MVKGRKINVRLVFQFETTSHKISNLVKSVRKVVVIAFNYLIQICLYNKQIRYTDCSSENKQSRLRCFICKKTSKLYKIKNYLVAYICKYLYISFIYLNNPVRLSS